MGKRDNQEVKKFANDKGFIVLQEYINIKTKMEFQCIKCGTVLHKSYENFIKVHNCPLCNPKINNSTRHTYDEVKNYIENEISNWSKLKLLSTEYINQYTPLHIIDFAGYQYNVCLYVVKNSYKRNLKLNRFFHYNTFTKENIINYLSITNSNYKMADFNNAKNAHDDIIFDCDKHGLFKMCWNQISNGHGCQQCGFEHTANIRRNDYGYIKDQFDKKGLVLISPNYINNQTDLEYVCKKHLECGIQRIKYMNLIDREGCFYCRKENHIKGMTKTQEEFEEQVYKIHKDYITVLGDYINSHTKINIRCNKCGYEWCIKPSHLLDGHSCPNCNKSLGENMIENYLIENHIIFKQQYKFKNCKGKRNQLPFDFAIFDDNDNLLFLIEYQGIQHFEPVGIFGGEKQFKTQLICDEIKRNYCKNSGIELLEIPYYEKENIKIILSQKLNILEE